MENMAELAYKYYQKFNAGRTGIDAIKLPSTSPANAAMSLERLTEAYKVIAAERKTLATSDFLQ